MITENKNLRQTGQWLLILGLIGGIVAAIFGFWSEETVEAMGVPEKAVDRHEAFAVITLIVFGILLIIRWWIKSRWSIRDRVIYFCVAMLGLQLLGATGFFGGELVYRFGAGVQTPSSPHGAPSPPTISP